MGLGEVCVCARVPPVCGAVLTLFFLRKFETVRFQSRFQPNILDFRTVSARVRDRRTFVGKKKTRMTASQFYSAS